jgi:hypothetical protein
VILFSDTGDINIIYYLIREYTDNRDIKIRYHYTDKITVDGYIKGLTKIKFKIFIKLFSLRVFKNTTMYIAVNLRTVL